MGNEWINKEELLRLIERSNNEDGLINREEFIGNVERLREYERPSPPVPKESMTTFRINNALELEAMINKYRNGVEAGIRESYFNNYFETLNEIEKDCLLRIMKYKASYDYNYLNKNYIPEGHLGKFLKVTERTLSNWRRHGLLNKYNISDYMNEYKRWFGYGDFYDLDEIRQVLINPYRKYEKRFDEYK